MAYTVHQCAHFSADPQKSHGNAICQIVRYLIGTRDQGIIMQPSGNDFEVTVDSDFAGNWKKETAVDKILTAKSQSGHLVIYSGCLVLTSVSFGFTCSYHILATLIVTLSFFVNWRESQHSTDFN